MQRYPNSIFSNWNIYIFECIVFRNEKHNFSKLTCFFFKNHTILLCLCNEDVASIISTKHRNTKLVDCVWAKLQSLNGVYLNLSILNVNFYFTNDLHQYVSFISMLIKKYTHDSLARMGIVSKCCIKLASSTSSFRFFTPFGEPSLSHFSTQVRSIFP